MQKNLPIVFKYILALSSSLWAATFCIKVCGPLAGDILFPICSCLKCCLSSLKENVKPNPNFNSLWIFSFSLKFENNLYAFYFGHHPRTAALEILKFLHVQGEERKKERMEKIGEFADIYCVKRVCRTMSQNKDYFY